MPIQRSSLQNNNSAIQTFIRDGVHIPTDGISDYVLLESSSIPANSNRIFRLRDRLLTLQPLIIWFTPSVTAQNFNFIIRQDLTSLYSFSVSSNAHFMTLPMMLIKPSQDIVLGTPGGLSLSNVYILAKEIAYSEIINGL